MGEISLKLSSDNHNFIETWLIIGFDDISVNSWSICLNFGENSRYEVGEYGGCVELVLNQSGPVLLNQF